MLLLYSRGNNVVVVVKVVVVRKRSMFVVVVVVIVTQAAESVGRERESGCTFVRSLNYTVVVTFFPLSTYWNGKNSTMQNTINPITEKQFTINDWIFHHIHCLGISIWAHSIYGWLFKNSILVYHMETNNQIIYKYAKIQELEWFQW